MNDNTTEEDQGESAVKTATQIMIGVIIASENLLLILVISVNPQLHTTKYLFTASLAVTDTIVGLIPLSALPLGLSTVIPREGTESLVSTLFVITAVGMVMLSFGQMAIIAGERYLYIVHPFLYERRITPLFIRSTVAVFWALGLVYIASMFIIQVYVIGEYVTLIRDINVYILKGPILGVYVCVTVFTCLCYVLILCQVKKHRRAVISIDTATATGNTAPTSGTSVKVSSWREHMKSLKFFLAVFGFYFLMTSPGFIEEGLPEVIHVSDEVRTGLVFTILLNSGINFWILNVVDKTFREITRKTLYHPLFVLKEMRTGS